MRMGGGREGENCSYSQTFHFVGSKRRERSRENFALDLVSFWNFSSYLNCQVEFSCVHNAGQYDMCCEEVAQVSCGQCKQLVPAVLQHVMPCSRILRLEYTSTKRYCVILTVKCAAAVFFICSFSGCYSAHRRYHVVWNRQKHDKMQIKLTML